MKIKKFNEDKSNIESSYIFLKCFDEEGEVVVEVLFDNEKDFGNYVLYNVNETILNDFKHNKKQILDTIKGYNNWMLDQRNIPFFYEWESGYDFINTYSDNEVMSYSTCELERNVELDQRSQTALSAKKYNL